MKKPEILNSDKIVKILWQLANNVITLIASVVTYLATDNVAWAVAIAPFVRSISEIGTRYINKRLS